MTRVCTYLNFPGTSEEAFHYYAELFGGRIVGPFVRFGEMASPVGPSLSSEEADKIMHMEVEIVGGHVLMATDVIESSGHVLRVGNNTTIMIEFDSRSEVDRAYAGLVVEDVENQSPVEMPWGQYWATCLDRFGVRWMFASPLA